MVRLLFVIVAFAGEAMAAPRAEVQVALCDSFEDLSHKLTLAPREAPYETWQFDNTQLSLLERGVRIRLRLKTGDAELAVKIAGQDCAALAIKKRDGKCEYDVYGGKAQGALSVTRKLDTASARELAAGRKSIASVLSESQIRHLGSLPDGIRALGPIVNGVYSDGRYDVDVSTLPGGRRYIEFGIKVPYADVDNAQRALDEHLALKHVAVCEDQRGQAAEKLRHLSGG